MAALYFFSPMPSPLNASRELAILTEMPAELESYLLAEAVFWPLRPGSDFPQLSLGMMWLTRARLRALASHLTPAQRLECERVEGQLDVGLARWAVAAENKAQKELRTRINLWRAFLSELSESPHASGEHYAHEVTHRVMAGLLLRHLPRLADSAETGRLPGLDAQLRSRFKPGNFAWQAELQSEFPSGEFWFLYGNV